MKSSLHSQDKRADNLKEAINLYHEEQHRSRIEEFAEEQLRLTEEAAQSSNEAAKYAREAAESAEEAIDRADGAYRRADEAYEKADDAYDKAEEAYNEAAQPSVCEKRSYPRIMGISRFIDLCPKSRPSYPRIMGIRPDKTFWNTDLMPQISRKSSSSFPDMPLQHRPYLCGSGPCRASREWCCPRNGRCRGISHRQVLSVPCICRILS